MLKCNWLLDISPLNHRPDIRENKTGYFFALDDLISCSLHLQLTQKVTLLTFNLLRQNILVYEHNRHILKVYTTLVFHVLKVFVEFFGYFSHEMKLINFNILHYERNIKVKFWFGKNETKVLTDTILLSCLEARFCGFNFVNVCSWVSKDSALHDLESFETNCRV